MVDYRKFRFNKLKGEFRYLLMLIWWPFYGIAFYIAEKCPGFVEKISITEPFIEVHCGLDDMIPFCELFLIPYLFWFVLLVGMHAYTLLLDVSAFKKMMLFIMISYTTTVVIYYLFPTEQLLRPEVFPRDNFLTRFMSDFYAYDTNTNVCPSLHVIGTWAAVYGAFKTERFRKKGWVCAFLIVGVLICLSTVFLKQHSVIDVILAIPVCLISRVITEHVFRDKNKKESVSQ